MNVLNENIKLIREKAGMTQSEFARLIGTTVSSVKNYENTDVKPKLPVLEKVAEFADLPVDDLILKRLTPEDLFKAPSGKRKFEKQEYLWLNTKDGPIDKAEFDRRYIDLQNDYITQLKKMSDFALEDVKNTINELARFHDRDFELMIEHLRTVELQFQSVSETFGKRFDMIEKKLNDILSKLK